MSFFEPDSFFRNAPAKTSRNRIVGIFRRMPEYARENRRLNDTNRGANIPGFFVRPVCKPGEQAPSRRGNRSRQKPAKRIGLKLKSGSDIRMYSITFSLSRYSNVTCQPNTLATCISIGATSPLIIKEWCEQSASITACPSR